MFVGVTEEIPEFVQRQRPSTRALFIYAFALIAGLWFLAFQWPTAYIYEHHNGRLVRVRRDGEGEAVLTGKGWLTLVSCDFDPYLNGQDTSATKYCRAHFAP